MVLDQLLQILPDARFDRSKLRSVRASTVAGITPDSKQAGPGIVFFSLPERQRENPFQVQAALERGAAAVICDPASPAPARSACVQVADARLAFSQTAALFHEHPARRLQVFGIGGEPEPRTRVAGWLTALLDACGQDPAWLGASHCLAGGRRLPWSAERLDAFQLQGQLAAHARSGGRSCVIELLPGLLAGGQLGAVDFVQQATAALEGHDALQPEQLSLRGSRVRLALGGTDLRVHCPVVGRSQLQALAQALELALGSGLPIRRLAAALPGLTPPAGVGEAVHCGQPFGVLVDGARDATSLALLLQDARELTAGRLLLVTGPRPEDSIAGRRALAETALALADQVVVTRDQTGPGDFQELVADFLGNDPQRCVRIEPDRHAAIRWVMREARAGDVVVLAGKGAAGAQRLGDAVVPWDDRLHAREALAWRGYVGRSW
jgi:UDP-N-acetylmuramoyl-L-alanyl-D-glutamate--2,6-diaminopimelate ligase